MEQEINEVNRSNEMQQKLNNAYDCEATGKPNEALKLCIKIIEIDPDFAEVYNLQGIVLEQLGRKQEAVESYEKAVKLDPNFEEASENLAGLKAELEPNIVEEDVVVYEDDRDAYKEDAIYVAKWGALAFSLAFGVESLLSEAFWVMNYYFSQPQQPGEIVTIGPNWIQDLLFVLLIGLATAVLGAVSQNRPIAFGLAGGLGYAFARWLVWGVVDSRFFMFIFGPLQFTNILDPIIIFSHMIIGAIYGAIVGMMTKDKRQVVWLALAGGIGFGLYFSVRMWFFSTFHNTLSYTLGFTGMSLNILRMLVDAFLAAILGTLLGGVLGWFAGEEILDEEDDVVIE